jgi:hypothetical protein
MHGKYLSRILMILVDNSTTGKFRHTHNAVGIIHSVFFHGIDRGVNLPPRTVKICCMHMDTERFATHHLRMYTSRICQPIVRMNNVEFLLTCHNSGYNREVIDFFVQISGITAGKVHTTKIIDVHIGEIRVNMVAQSIILLRTHCRQTRLQIIVINITPHDRHLVHTDYIQEFLFFTCRLRHTESSLHISLLTQTLRDSV